MAALSSTSSREIPWLEIPEEHRFENRPNLTSLYDYSVSSMKAANGDGTLNILLRNREGEKIVKAIPIRYEAGSWTETLYGNSATSFSLLYKKVIFTFARIKAKEIKSECDNRYITLQVTKTMPTIICKGKAATFKLPKTTESRRIKVNFYPSTTPTRFIDKTAMIISDYCGTESPPGFRPRFYSLWENEWNNCNSERYIRTLLAERTIHLRSSVIYNGLVNMAENLLGRRLLADIAEDMHLARGAVIIRPTTKFSVACSAVPKQSIRAKLSRDGCYRLVPKVQSFYKIKILLNREEEGGAILSDTEGRWYFGTLPLTRSLEHELGHIRQYCRPKDYIVRGDARTSIRWHNITEMTNIGPEGMDASFPLSENALARARGEDRRVAYLGFDKSYKTKTAKEQFLFALNYGVDRTALELFKAHELHTKLNAEELNEAYLTPSYFSSDCVIDAIGYEKPMVNIPIDQPFLRETWDRKNRIIDELSEFMPKRLLPSITEAPSLEN